MTIIFIDLIVINIHDLKSFFFNVSKKKRGAPSRFCMDILNDLPIRLEAIDEHSNTRKRKDTPNNLLSVEEENKRRKKVIMIDDKGRSLQKPLGLNIQDDYFEIDKIKKLPLPREDGIPWTFWEQTEEVEKKRPYGKTYLSDHAMRQKILSENDNYHALSELAGALRKELIDIVDPEDMNRVVAEQEQERLQNTIELKRTLIDMDKKYELVQKLKEMNRSEQANYDDLRSREVPYALTLLSRYLIDNKTLPGTYKNSLYGFQELVSLAHIYNDAVTNDTNHHIVMDKILASSVGVNLTDYTIISERFGIAGERLFFYLYTYYRDFLNNESDYSLRDAIENKLIYALDHYTELTGKPLIPILFKKEEEGVESTHSIDTLQQYERQMDQVMDELGGRENPFTVFNEFYEANKGSSGVDWQLYKQRHTKLINIPFFDRLDIAKETEKKMVERGVTFEYGEEVPLYAKQVVIYLYGNASDRNDITMGDDGFLLLSGDVSDGGHPTAIDTLIRLQYPNYDKIGASLKGTMALDIETLLRAHFLFLYFEETSWTSIISLLMPEQEKIITNLRNTVAPIASVLDTVLIVYKELMMLYLRLVAVALYKQKPPLLSLPATAEAILLSDNTKSQGVTSAAYLFDELNTMLKDINLRDIIRDDLFYEYLFTGSDAFLKYRYENNNGISSVQQQQPSNAKGTKIEIDSEYPALIIHDLLRAYTAYRREYLLMSSENLAHINTAIQKANRKIAEVVGDESYSIDRRPIGYRQKKSFTTKPENSGFIKLRDEIVFLLRRTYQFVMNYVPNLQGLPFEAFQTKNAFDSGLWTDFVDVVAAVGASREFTFNEGYRTELQLKKIQIDKQGTMERLRNYLYYGNCNKGYTIRKNMEFTPIFAVRNLLYAPVYTPTTQVDQTPYRPSRLMW